MLAPQKNQNPMWSNFGDRRVLNLQYNCLAVQAAASPRRRLKEKVSEIVRSNGHIITIKIGVAGYNILKRFSAVNFNTFIYVFGKYYFKY